jgi:heme-binding uptake protein ChaN (Tiki superfamily)
VRRSIVIALLLSGMPAAGNELADYLRTNGRMPDEYILSKVATHSVVLLGENHWLAHDADLVQSIVPGLLQRGVALAMEVLPAEAQTKIDELVSAEQWNGPLATEIMRLADWPYAEYREILHAVWKANRTRADTPPMVLIALGPPSDWRKKGIRYDEFMAGRVMDYAGDERRHVVAYVGMHHAFTRYLQVERRIHGRASEFMNRFGNILWRRYGEDVFLIALHKPEWCGPPDDPTSLSCLPFDGALDCAADGVGHAVAFDVIGSPVAELKFAPTSFYAFAYPLLRLYDYADGYVWTETAENTTGVHQIPLAEYSPERANDSQRIAEWEKREAELSHPFQRRGFDRVTSWRTNCGH